MRCYTLKHNETEKEIVAPETDPERVNCMLRIIASDLHKEITEDRIGQIHKHLEKEGRLVSAHLTMTMATV